MRASVILLIAVSLLLANLTQAAVSDSESHKKKEINREKFRGLKRKRQLLSNILNLQGGDLISLFSPRFEIGTSYGQTNHNDLQFNSNNDNSMGRENAAPYNSEPFDETPSGDLFEDPFSDFLDIP